MKGTIKQTTNKRTERSMLAGETIPAFHEITSEEMKENSLEREESEDSKQPKQPKELKEMKLLMIWKLKGKLMRKIDREVMIICLKLLMFQKVL